VENTWLQSVGPENHLKTAVDDVCQPTDDMVLSPNMAPLNPQVNKIA
jgi:hypothetical protein